MALTNAERKLITAGNKVVRERLDFKRDLERELRLSTVRRARIGDNYRQKMLEKALKNAGVDYDLIRQRQAKESESGQKDLKKFEARLNANVKTVAARHQQLREQLQQTKFVPRFRTGGSSAASELGYLQIPSYTDLDDENTPKNAAITPGQQAVDGVYLTFDWKTGVVDAWNARVTAFFNYLWTPPANGSLSVISLAAYNGTGRWSINAGCGYDGSFDTSFTTSLTVQQTDAAGHLFTADGQPAAGIQDNHNGGCTHHSGVKPYDQVDFLELSLPLGVEQNLPVLITILIEGSSDAFFGAGGEIDFSTNGKSINLPGVLTGFTPDS